MFTYFIPAIIFFSKLKCNIFRSLRMACFTKIMFKHMLIHQDSFAKLID